ncbi:recombinase family protein [Streptomyces sp. NPDC058290]|uniref:recombinase family protein n=1 Tax=Streptomyces sp. NPDC058290 TaxID=3346426 RepID=UPI0036E3F302
MTEGIDMSSPMGKMFGQIIAAFAEGELDTIRARALSGSLARLGKGVWSGGVQPFGYPFHQQADGGKRLVRDHLRVQQGNAPRGIEWTSNAVRAAVKNPTVGGVYTYKGKVVEDEEGNPVPITDEPILPYAAWSKVVARLDSSKKPMRSAPSRSMLGGVVVCEACGGPMSSSKRVTGVQHRQ